MMTSVSLTNVSFSFLKGSPEFLDLVLDNINSAVLLLNNRMQLISFNNALFDVFTKNKEKDLKYVRCGEAIGCAYQVEEQKQCGETSKCKTCELRLSAISTYLENTTTFRKEITRPFYLDNNEKVNMKLQYTTKYFAFENDKYILMLIECMDFES